MPDKSKKFHEFALKSVLFKGRSDWYFCYLKSERIAHVLSILAARAAANPVFEALVEKASALPESTARLAAGEFEPSAVLADVFGLLSGTRLAATQGILSQEQASLIAGEYEQLAERLLQGSHPSPFVSGEDFFVPELPAREAAPLPQPIKDIKDMQRLSFITKGQVPQESERSTIILNYIREKKSVSIKDIGKVVRGCSEKTIQRELAALIERGLIRRVGKRRWSQYLPI